MPSKSCPKCSGSLSQGFVVDQTYGATAVPTWVEGTPQKSIWTGLKLDGRPQIEIETWRCGRCGFLEHYAAGGPGRQQETRKRVQLIVLIVAAVFAILFGVVAMLLVF